MKAQLKEAQPMASDDLNGMRVAILITNGFEEVEMTEPRKALDSAGAKTEVVSPAGERVRSWKFKEWGEYFPVDIALTKARPNDFDALLLPGGVMNPDALRLDPEAVQFVKAFFNADKPVAVICHGPWTVIEAGTARGRRIASWPSLKTDLKNAGAEWVDQEVVVDRRLVSSRKPDDIPAFNREMLRLFGRARSSTHRVA
jgi:protease I